MTTQTLTLVERALAAHEASELAYRKGQERLREETAADDRERLGLLLKQILGVDDVQVDPAPSRKDGEARTSPTATVDGLRFTLIGELGWKDDLGVFVSCPRCDEEIVERLPRREPHGLTALGRILSHPEGHRGMCPKDLDEEGYPKDGPPAPSIALPMSPAERLVENLRALIREELGE